MVSDSAPQETQEKREEEQVVFNIVTGEDHKSVTIKMESNFVMSVADIIGMMERWIADVKERVESKG